MSQRLFICLFVLFASAAGMRARYKLGQDELKILQDSGGWEYLTISDSDSGIQTQHTCFNGQPHPEECRGTLIFKSDNTFTQSVFVHHQSVNRHGTYWLEGDQLALFDEFGTRDGPYAIAINIQNKSMTMRTGQIRIELELEKEYRKQRSKRA